jgi:hypothetical protein
MEELVEVIIKIKNQSHFDGVQTQQSGFASQAGFKEL